MSAQLALDLFPETTGAPSGPGIYAWTWDGSEFRGRIAAWAAGEACWIRLEVLWRDGEACRETQEHHGMVRWPELRGMW